MKTHSLYWYKCDHCKGIGKHRRKLRKKVKINYQLALSKYENSSHQGEPPKHPKGHLENCQHCKGKGIVQMSEPVDFDSENYPHVAIIGSGIGGVALAIACLHRGIPFTLYERDNSFNQRKQGYGLTLQQASKAVEGLGITDLKGSLISTRHVVHKTNGSVLGEWGNRQLNLSADYLKRKNIHISRQNLRLALLDQIGGDSCVRWSHNFESLKEEEGHLKLCFNVNGQIKKTQADLVVGADGIHSQMRKILFTKEASNLKYLGCIVILGICSLDQLKGVRSDLLDSATVFQTVNGEERMYMMPFTSDSIMWQFSYLVSEQDAKSLSDKGALYLKQEASRRAQWHDPIPQILAATELNKISGYPVYDRPVLNAEMFETLSNATLIGDAAHPMSPFKGQGANQAILDALSLAKLISSKCHPHSAWRQQGLRKTVLSQFEAEMLKRSNIKVKDSAKAAELLHSQIVLKQTNEPRGVNN